jgi:uncharacterized protein YhfF
MHQHKKYDPEWEKYLSGGHQAWHFCNNREDADKLADLVIAGVKRATASLALCYEEDGEELPKPGDISIILRWSGEPAAVIETTKVELVPYRDVSAAFAAEEGEGDGSLEYWRSVHEPFFTTDCGEYGVTFSPDLPVVCESFRKLLP